MLRALTVVIHSFVPSFHIGSERIKVGQVRFDTKRRATRLDFGFPKKQIVFRADWKVHLQFSTGRSCVLYFLEIHADLPEKYPRDWRSWLAWIVGLFVLTNSRPKEATDLLDAGVVKANDITRTVFNQTHGFACCSARQCIQRRIADRIVIVFHSWLQMFHISAEGFRIHSLSCFKLFFGTVRLSLFVGHFFQCSQHQLQELINNRQK